MTAPAGADAAARWCEVNALLTAYLAAVDGADLDRVAELLGRATVRMPAGVLEGGAAVREAYSRVQPEPHPDGRRRTKHHLTNLVVSEPEADGSVVADAYYLVLEEGPDGPRVAKSGRFRDRFEQVSGRWAIREHHVIADL